MEPEPHLHHPNVREEVGLYCFMNKDRPCGADCMSYIVQPEGSDYRDQQWARCLLLVNAHRAGKHLVVLADITNKLFNISRTKQADDARLNQPPAPTVR